MTTNGDPPRAAAAEDGRFVSGAATSTEYVLRLRPCADGFTASLRERRVDGDPEVRESIGPIAFGVARTAADAMTAAIANARIADPPIGPMPARRRRTHSGRLIL